MMMGQKTEKAQSILEFTAAMVVLSLLMYGLIQVFRWGMMDMAERRWDNDHTFTNVSLSVVEQINPNFHTTRPLDAVWYKKP